MKDKYYIDKKTRIRFYADPLTVKYVLQRKYFGIIWCDEVDWVCDLVPESVTLGYVIRKLTDKEEREKAQFLSNIERYVPAWERHRD